MKWLLLLVLLMPGCLFDSGLGSSTTDCPASAPVEHGFVLLIEPAEPFVGHCVELVNTEDWSRVLVARQVPSDGRVFVPVDEAGRFHMAVSVERADDKYCAHVVGESAHHPGTGWVEIVAEIGMVCS